MASCHGGRKFYQDSSNSVISNSYHCGRYNSCTINCTRYSWLTHQFTFVLPNGECWFWLQETSAAWIKESSKSSKKSLPKCQPKLYCAHRCLCGTCTSPAPYYIEPQNHSKLSPSTDCTGILEGTNEILSGEVNMARTPKATSNPFHQGRTLLIPKVRVKPQAILGRI